MSHHDSAPPCTFGQFLVNGDEFAVFELRGGRVQGIAGVLDVAYPELFERLRIVDPPRVVPAGEVPNYSARGHKSAQLEKYEQQCSAAIGVRRRCYFIKRDVAKQDFQLIPNDRGLCTIKGAIDAQERINSTAIEIHPPHRQDSTAERAEASKVAQ